MSVLPKLDMGVLRFCGREEEVAAEFCCDWGMLGQYWGLIFGCLWVSCGVLRVTGGYSEVCCGVSVLGKKLLFHRIFWHICLWPLRTRPYHHYAATMTTSVTESRTKRICWVYPQRERERKCSPILLRLYIFVENDNDNENYKHDEKINKHNNKKITKNIRSTMSCIFLG